MASLITFSSDYGTDDEFVGVCRLVIARIAPDARVVDLAHGLTGVRAGAAALRDAVSFAPQGSVHLAIVDPGVGTSRLGIAVTTRRGDVLVGPDNGLLVPAAQVLGGVASVVELASSDFRLAPVSSTFHGRDVFAPAAAHLARGLDPTELGPAVDPGRLVRITAPDPELSDGQLSTEVVRADRFGNLQLAATGADFDRAGLSGDLEVTCAAGAFDAVRGSTFADAPPGGLVAFTDSAGMAALARNGGSARELLQEPERLTLKRKA